MNRLRHLTASDTHSKEVSLTLMDEKSMGMLSYLAGMQRRKWFNKALTLISRSGRSVLPVREWVCCCKLTDREK
jgi:hypothetical protein